MLSTNEVNFIVGYITTAQLFVLSFSFYFLVRVRCSRRKFTFALSSADEFLVIQFCRPRRKVAKFQMRKSSVSSQNKLIVSVRQLTVCIGSHQHQSQKTTASVSPKLTNGYLMMKRMCVVFARTQKARITLTEETSLSEQIDSNRQTDRLQLSRYKSHHASS